MGNMDWEEELRALPLAHWIEMLESDEGWARMYAVHSLNALGFMDKNLGPALDALARAMEKEKENAWVLDKMLEAWCWATRNGADILPHLPTLVPFLAHSKPLLRENAQKAFRICMERRWLREFCNWWHSARRS